MIVAELIAVLSRCDQKAQVKIIGEEELECLPEYWDEDKEKVAGKATSLYSEDLHSHEFHLLAIDK